MSRSAAIWLRPNLAGRGPRTCLSHGDAGHSLSTECKVESPLPNAVNSLPHLQTKWKELKKKKSYMHSMPVHKLFGWLLGTKVRGG